MRIQTVIEELNALKQAALIDQYAIGGAIAAAFYVEPVSTLDIDVFVDLHVQSGKLILDPTPIFDFFAGRGFSMSGEYVVVGNWPVQFLSASGPLEEEAIRQARTFELEGVPARIFSAEHVAAIALKTGRAKDKMRLLDFVEQDVLDTARFQQIVTSHGLLDAWADFRRTFLGERQ